MGPLPQATRDYKQTRTYAYAYLASQYLIFVVAAVGIGVAIRNLSGLNESIGAANRQANAAATQARIAQQEFEASERPWIGLSATEVNGYPRDDNRIAVTFGITNSGKSPAQHVWFRNLTLSPLGKEWNALTECRDKPADAGVGVLLLPNLPHQMGPLFSDLLEPNTVEYIREQLGQKPKTSPPVNLHPQGIIFIGCIDYVWNDRCFRTRFCEQYVPVPSQGRPYGSFTYCDFNNDTDENEHCQIHK